MSQQIITARQYLAAVSKNQSLENKWDISDIWDIIQGTDEIVRHHDTSTDWLEYLREVGKFFGMESKRDESLEWLQKLDGDIKGMSKGIDALKKRVDDISGDQRIIKAEVEALMRQQQQSTAAILNAISGVSNQISHMSDNIDAWFRQTMHQLGDLEDMMRGLAALLTTVLDVLSKKIEEVKKEVQWGSVVGILVEYQLRVSYAIDMALNVRLIAPKNQDADPQVFDARELEEWARHTCDLATGLSYYMYSLHHIIVGDTVIKKPLMTLYMQLYSTDDDVQLSAARFYGHLVGLQCRGLAVVLMARDYIGLRSADDALDAEFRSRIKDQVRATSEGLDSCGLGPWSGMGQNGYKVGQKLPEIFSRPPDGECYMMVPGANQVACGLVLDPVLTLQFGIVEENGTVKNLESTAKYRGGSENFTNYNKSGVLHTTLLGYNDMKYYFDDRGVLVGQQYAIVGFKISVAGGCGRLEPVVAAWDQGKRTTSWTGTGGKVLLVSLAKKTSIKVAGRRQVYAGDINLRGLPRRMLRGARLSSQLDAKDKSKACFVIPCANDSWTKETWIPLDESEGVKYEEVQVPSA